MKIEKVRFGKKIGMPGYSSDNIEVEGELELGETKEEAWSKMNKDIMEWHKREYPHLYQERGCEVLSPEEFVARTGETLFPVILENKSPESTRISFLISNICSCTELKVLESYQLMVKKDSQLQAAYDQQYKKLLNA